jgi:hypothetical protein
MAIASAGFPEAFRTQVIPRNKYPWIAPSAFGNSLQAIGILLLQKSSEHPKLNSQNLKLHYQGLPTRVKADQ